jgi:hypothetical protein
MAVLIKKNPVLGQRFSARLADKALRRAAKECVANIHGTCGPVVVNMMIAAISDYFDGRRCPERFNNMTKNIRERILAFHPELRTEFNKFVRHR